MIDIKQLESYYNVSPKYINELYLLQVELLRLQKYISENKLRLMILFEGRDTAGKGSAIARFTQFLNPQYFKSVALGKPTGIEKRQWYFQRHIKHLPNAGKMVLFDRSWYNRAVVEPVMGFCTKNQYEKFIEEVKLLETMLVKDGIVIIKFWFSINAEEQKNRIEKRLNSPLEQWKVSPVDLAAQEKWEEFTKFKKLMFVHTASEISPWVVVKGKVREERRIQAMRYVLDQFDYDMKSEALKKYDSNNIKIIV